MILVMVSLESPRQLSAHSLQEQSFVSSVGDFNAKIYPPTPQLTSQPPKEPSSSSERIFSPPLHHSANSIKSKCEVPFKRQAAIDLPVSANHNNNKKPPAIIFSPENSFDSSPTYTGSGIQRAKHEQWSSQQQSSVTSSAKSNGDIRHSVRSRKNSLFDLKEATKRKFSLLPHVSSIAHASANCLLRTRIQFYCSDLIENSNYFPILILFASKIIAKIMKKSFSIKIFVPPMIADKPPEFPVYFSRQMVTPPQILNIFI